MNATRRARSFRIDSLERLDGRITPSGGVAPHAVPSAVISYSPNGTAMDKLGQTLNIVYQEYLDFAKQGGHGTFTSSQSSKVSFRLPAGTTDGSLTQVAVSIQVPKGLFDQAIADTAKLGMEVGATDRAHGIITGFIPLSQLAAAANDADFTNVAPIYQPPARVPFRGGR